MSDFLKRHLGIDSKTATLMLQTLGLNTMDELLEKAINHAVPLSQTSSTPDHPLSEYDALKYLKKMANLNRVGYSMIGMGYHNTNMPFPIKRHLLENPGWYTAYTPYQAEISQGRLFLLCAFQQMIMDLTGFEVANASLLDEGTAAFEAMMVCWRARTHQQKNTTHFFVDKTIHPHVLNILKTRAPLLNIDLIIDDPLRWKPSETFGGMLYYINTYGYIGNHQTIIQRAKDAKNQVVMGADILSLLLLESPGKLQADLVFGSTQRLGLPMGFGGPHAAFLASTAVYKRHLPGRIIGASKDKDGQTAYRMALQTREQHIRRAQATSNICTAQALPAILAVAFAIYHGPDGLKRIAQSIAKKTHAFACWLQENGYVLRHRHFFDTLCIETPHASTLYENALKQDIYLRFINQKTLVLSFDECTKPDHINALKTVFQSHATICTSVEKIHAIPVHLKRSDQPLQHSVFNEYHTETQFLRLVHRLQSKDFALDYHMIALGSCTMKLNATSQLIPISWSQWCNIHPYAPTATTQGYQALIAEFSQMMKTVTGLPEISVQPNSGAQGEYAGLLAIKSYFLHHNQPQRNICLIPNSAHGTNPASACIAGMQIVLVNVDKHGNIDATDFKTKALEHQKNLAACMITYPSTHGVFENSILEITKTMHRLGGWVYLDGANLNAMVGCVLMSDLGADVMHINLHKTFCVPHGGGGPGVGVLASNSALGPFLPDTFCDPVRQQTLVSSAPFGSALLLCISWMYIKTTGMSGLRTCTQTALLNANYMRQRLAKKYTILYTNPLGFVAHEFIIDIRTIEQETQITEQDIAKRLMDYGFHAPTVSFPVAGSLMIEPTESECKKEIDLFCDALLSIFEEIQCIKNGVWSLTDNPLKNAPHTQNQCMQENWLSPYSRMQAAFPMPHLTQHKKWPSVARIDEVWGDRHLKCGCE